jgi:hypothetical protein
LVGEAAAIKAAGAVESTTGRTKADKTAVGRADMETAMGTTITTTTGSTRAHRRAGRPHHRQATPGTTRACLPRPLRVTCPAEVATGMRPRRPRDTEAIKAAVAVATKAAVATRVDRAGTKEDTKADIRPAPLRLRATARVRTEAATTTATADHRTETIGVVVTTGEGTTTETTAAAGTSGETRRDGRRQRL